MNTKTNNIKHKLLIGAKILLAVSLLIFIFGKVIDVRQIVQALSKMQWAYFVVALLLQWIVVLICTHRLMILLRAQKVYLKFLCTLRCNCIGFFFNLFSLGTTGGDVVKAFYVARETDHFKTESVTVVFLDRMLGLGAVLLIAACSLVSTIFITNAFRFLIPFVLLAILMAVIAVLFIFTKNYWRKYKWWQKINQYIPSWIRRIINAIHIYRTHKMIGIIALLESIAVQLIMCIIAWCLGIGLGFDIPVSSYFIVFPLAILIMVLPISPSGLGTGEYAFMEGFKQFGVDPGRAVTFVVLLRLLMLSLSFAGFIFWIIPKNHIKSEELIKGVENLKTE